MLLKQQFVTSFIAQVTFLLIVGCQSTGSPEPLTTQIAPIDTAVKPTATPINPVAVLKRSGKTMEELETFHFHLRHKDGALEFSPGLIINEIEGYVVKPNKISVSFSGAMGTGLAIKSNLIGLGDEVYMTNPLTGQWAAGPEAINVLGFFNPNQGVQMMISQIQQTSLENSDSSKFLTITGLLHVSALAPLVGHTLKDSIVKVELIIDSNLFYLLEAKFIGAVTPTDRTSTTRIVTLSMFNKPASIKAPITQSVGP